MAFVQCALFIHMVGPIFFSSLRQILYPNAQSSQRQFSPRPINFHYYENEGFLTTHPFNKMPPRQIQPLKVVGAQCSMLNTNTQFIQVLPSFQIIILHMDIGKHRGTIQLEVGLELKYPMSRIE